MPRELVTIQIGQCGIQLGTRFWDLSLTEHGLYNKGGLYDDALSSFFRNCDSKTSEELPVGNGKGPIRALKARAILVDMEEGVINELMTSPLAEIFDKWQRINDVSGAGNNWAHGHEVYGPQYEESIMETVRRTTESCDSLQSFFLMHSLGGGTGSGLGTYILRCLEDQYPEVYRFVTGVFPSDTPDVNTSPYNAMLSLHELIQHADCVLPIENQALIDICDKINSAEKKATSKGEKPTTLAPAENKEKDKKSKSKPFDMMNTIAAHVLTNLTCSMRFEGPLNVDLNEITLNLVPYPRLHFLLASLSPLSTVLEKKSTAASRGIDHMFTDAFNADNHLLKVNPKQDTYLACGLLARGKLQVSDINRNVARLKSGLNMIHWNQDGFKVGLCASPPVGQPYAVLGLANNCCIKNTFAAMHSRCMQLYNAKAYLFHYTQYMDEGLMVDALHGVEDLILDYASLQKYKAKPVQRLVPVL